MDAPSYMQHEARNCLHLAQIEEHSEMKVILMGMALGWLSIAKEWSADTDIEATDDVEMMGDEAIEEITPESEVVR